MGTELESLIEAPSRDLADREALPVCLCPWLENPYRLVSLLDMLTFYTHDFCRASGIIGQLYAQVQAGVVPASGSWSLIAGELGMLERACEKMGLTTTLAQIQRIKPTFVEGSNQVLFHPFTRDIMEIHTRMLDELQGKHFLYIGNDEHFFAEPLRDWKRVVARLPQTNDDAEEASKCFALERYGASIFHLMRISEAAALELGKLVDPADHKPQFSSVLKKIDNLVQKTRWQDWPIQAQLHKALFVDVLPRLYAVKDSWRDKFTHFDNHIVPTTATGSRERALDIYNCTLSLMNLIAERLP
jgi:hypothetical protein